MGSLVAGLASLGQDQAYLHQVRCYLHSLIIEGTGGRATWVASSCTHKRDALHSSLHTGFWISAAGLPGCLHLCFCGHRNRLWTTCRSVSDDVHHDVH